MKPQALKPGDLLRVIVIHSLAGSFVLLLHLMVETLFNIVATEKMDESGTTDVFCEGRNHQIEISLTSKTLKEGEFLNIKTLLLQMTSPVPPLLAQLQGRCASSLQAARWRFVEAWTSPNSISTDGYHLFTHLWNQFFSTKFFQFNPSSSQWFLLLFFLLLLYLLFCGRLPGRWMIVL